MIKKYVILTLILGLITTQSYGIFDLKTTFFDKINDIKNILLSYRYLFIASAEEKIKEDDEKYFVELNIEKLHDELLSNPQVLDKYYENGGCDLILEALISKKNSKNHLFCVKSRVSLPAILSDMYNAYNTLIQKRLNDPSISSDVKERFMKAKQILNTGNVSDVQEIIAPLLINELSEKERKKVDSFGNSSVSKVFQLQGFFNFPEIEPIVALHNELGNYIQKILFRSCLEKGYYKDIFGE